MKKVAFAISAAFLVSGAGGVSRAQQTVETYNQYGYSAFFTQNSNGNSVEVGVTEDRSKDDRTVWLHYFWKTVDPTSRICSWWGGCYYTRYTWEGGDGYIPSTDFTTQRGQAVVNTTVASSSTFHISGCTIDYINWSSNNCYYTGAGGGAINVTFTATGGDVYKKTGTTDIKNSYPTLYYNQHQAGTTIEKSVSATGTVIAVPFTYSAYGWGNLTYGRNVTRTVVRNVVPSQCTVDGGACIQDNDCCGGVCLENICGF
jgi:hypothetical protein